MNESLKLHRWFLIGHLGLNKKMRRIVRFERHLLLVIVTLPFDLVRYKHSLAFLRPQQSLWT